MSEEKIQVGGIYTFPGKPGYWRITEGDGDSGVAQRISKAEAEAELKERALLKRLGDLCNA